VANFKIFLTIAFSELVDFGFLTSWLMNEELDYDRA
jgi:hypothetical protein